MVTQYPHTITFKTLPANVRSVKGDFVAQTPTESGPYKCRFEQNTGNAMIKGETGEFIRYNGIVYLPLASLTEDYPVGTKAIVSSGETELSSGKVLRFVRGQLNIRIWL